MTEPIDRLPRSFWCTRYDATSRSKPGRAAISYDDVAAASPRPIAASGRPTGGCHWGRISRLRRWLRVATLEDGETVLNAFLDRGFKP